LVHLQHLSQVKDRSLDQIDLRIIRILQADGRRPFTEIAQEVGVSEGTVRNRVARMIDDQILHVVGMVDPYHLGFDAPALIGVTLRPGELEPAVADIAAFEEVSYLVMVSGDFDLMVEVMCRDRQHLAEFLSQRLGRVPGVLRTQTLSILRTYKMAYGARPVLAPPGRLPEDRRSLR
jgi:Lrp/AsnC family transcriptional regulator for asnA, asnC and gidA